jgi:hypothetical protein
MELEKIKESCKRRALVLDHLKRMQQEGIFIPSPMLEESEKLFSEILIKLKACGVDGEEYLKQPDVQAELVLLEDTERTAQESSDRCGRCDFYQMFSDKDETKYTCGQGVAPYMDVCNLFKDTGMPFEQRVQVALHNCETCKKNKPYIDEIDIVYHTCTLRLNQLKEACEKRDPL